MSKLISREAFLSADDLKFEDVPVPEMGEDASVRIQVMPGNVRDVWEEGLTKRRDVNDKITNLKGMKAELLVECAVDDDGTRLFTAEDVMAINEKNGTVIDRLCDVAMKLNGLSDKSLEEMRKNSEADPS